MTLSICGMGVNGEGEDWSVAGSDDEKYTYEGGPKGIWMPSTEDIRVMFEKLEKGEVLDLKWKCPGRRKPDDESNLDNDATQEPMQVVVEKPKKLKPTVPDEFDFDDFGDDQPGKVTPITPRRTPGSKTPKSTKRVARMDKVLDDLMRQRKLLAAEKQAKRLALQNSPRGSLSNQHSPRPSASNQLSPRASGPNSPIRSHVGLANPTTPDRGITMVQSTPSTESSHTSNLPGAPAQGPIPLGIPATQPQTSDANQNNIQNFPAITLHGLPIPGISVPGMTVSSLSLPSSSIQSDHPIPGSVQNQTVAKPMVQSPVTKTDINPMEVPSNLSQTTITESCNTDFDFDEENS